jgi:hypothetical protein
VLRVEMSEFDVSVSVIEPAYVATSIFGKVTKVPHSASLYRAPLHRGSTPP